MVCLPSRYCAYAIKSAAIALLSDLYAEGIKGLLRCQDKDTGLFYQVLNLPDEEGNYQETSGSAMLAAYLFSNLHLPVRFSGHSFKIRPLDP